MALIHFIERELVLEEEMFNRGKDRFFANIARLKEQRNEGGTTYGKMLLKRGIAPLAAAITPRASDSVAPDVKSTSWMPAPSWWATLSRASSSMRRARRPPEWRAAGLPGEAPSSRWAATARATAS